MKKQARFRQKRVWSQKEKEEVPCEGLEVEKHKEAETIRCFDLLLVTAKQNKVKKKKRFAKDSYLPACVYLSCPRLSPSFNYFIHFVIKGKEKKQIIFLYEKLQEKTEKSTPNDEYENFVNAHLEAAAKHIPTKIKTKYRVPWETLAVREKRALVKTASKNYRKNPTNTNALKLKTAQYQLAGIYIKEQTEYIQNQIDKIRDSVEDRQSRIAWQTINEESRRKNTAKAKLKAANQQERIKLWKQHFENLLGNPPKITHEPITRIISKQLDIKLGPFTQEELDSVLRKIKNRKAAGLDEIPPEVWKTRQFDDILLRHCNAVYNQNPIDRWTKGCILPFPKKGDLGLAKNYRGITLTSIAAKIYNALLRNRIEPKIDNILRKNQNGFRRNRSTTSQILTIRRILEGVRAKNLQATLIFVDFTTGFRLHSQRKDGTNPTSVRHT